MTISEQMLALLREEEQVLRDRDFEKLSPLKSQKEKLLQALASQNRTDGLAKLKAQAERNAGLLKSVLDATRAARGRLDRLEVQSQSVGYAEDGESMACAEEKNGRTV